MFYRERSQTFTGEFQFHEKKRYFLFFSWKWQVMICYISDLDSFKKSRIWYSFKKMKKSTSWFLISWYFLSSFWVVQEIGRMILKIVSDIFWKCLWYSMRWWGTCFQNETFVKMKLSTINIEKRNSFNWKFSLKC